ncbi:unnamed protein product [Calypogeia fissa]
MAADETLHWRDPRRPTPAAVCFKTGSVLTPQFISQSRNPSSQEYGWSSRGLVQIAVVIALVCSAAETTDILKKITFARTSSGTTITAEAAAFGADLFMGAMASSRQDASAVNVYDIQVSTHRRTVWVGLGAGHAGGRSPWTAH